MSEQNPICEGCPAAFALGSYRQEYAGQESYKAEIHLKESETAMGALKLAAGQTACREIAKDLPALPDDIPPVGSPELIALVSMCPSFVTYLELRQAEQQ